MNTRRSRTVRLISVAALAAAAVVVAGCSPFAGGGGAADGDVELTLVTLDGGDDNKALEDIIAGFEDANPGVSVSATFVPEDTYATKLKTMLLAEPPDIASPYGWDQTLTFEPLNDLVLTDYDVDLDEYSSVIRTTCEWDGTVFCLGTTVGSMVTFYNKDMFDEKGIAYPDATTPMTFEEMADLAARLTTAGSSPEDTVYGAEMALLVAYLDPANVLDDTGRIVEVTEPEFADTVQLLADMVADGVSPSAGVLDALGGGLGSSLFVDGRVAMMITDNFAIDLLEEAEMNYGIAPTPIVAGNEPWIVSWTNGFGIPRGAENRDEAAKFLAYMAQEGQTIQAEFGIMPTQLEVAQDWADTPERQQLFEVNSLIRTSVFNPNQWAWNGPIIDAIAEANLGGPVEQLLGDAEPKAQQGNDTTWEQFDQVLAASGLE
ncbi:ABC transporter substrate-binding protein [Microbacterium insulae]|uniref:ABC transporter substrate-binding protein n=1 Tax=Microbacterium insulae TaxID=483014 RepID=A0ABW3AI68_9MICO